MGCLGPVGSGEEVEGGVSRLQLRPHQFFRSLVTRGSSEHSTYDNDRSVRERSHDGRGRIASL